MERLLEGYAQFRASGWPEQRRLLQSLARDGQSPKYLVLACIDSRVDPAMIFHAAPGEMLVVRNVANLAPPYAPDLQYHGTSAALEFGVRVLAVQHIVVLGHGLCGGVRRLLEGPNEKAQDFIDAWMSMGEPARRRVQRLAPEDRQRNCEFEIVKISLENLLTFPWIRESVTQGKLALHGAWFDIHSGDLALLQPDGLFAPRPASEVELAG